MLLVFLIVFSAPVISRIEYIGVGGREESGVSSGGRWEAKGGLKQQFGLKEHCCAFSI